MLKLGNKTAKTNPEKAQLFAKSVKRNFGIESHLFRKSHFDQNHKFVEAHSYHFTPLIPGYDTIKNDRSTGQGGGVAFLLKNGLVVNKEYRNDDFNIINDNDF